MKKRKKSSGEHSIFASDQISQDNKTDIKPDQQTAELGAGRQYGDPLSATLSDRAGDESFDDDTRLRGDGKLSEEADDL